MTPLCAPEPYTPSSDVASLLLASDQAVAAEIFCRPDGTYGFRCVAWVAWRDANGEVRGHSWWELPRVATFVMDSLIHAKERAAQILAEAGLTYGSWHDA